jgi:hypothetical protein
MDRFVVDAFSEVRRALALLDNDEGWGVVTLRLENLMALLSTAHRYDQRDPQVAQARAALAEARGISGVRDRGRVERLVTEAANHVTIGILLRSGGDSPP